MYLNANPDICSTPGQVMCCRYVSRGTVPGEECSSFREGGRCSGSIRGSGQHRQPRNRQHRPCRSRSANNFMCSLLRFGTQSNVYVNTSLPASSYLLLLLCGAARGTTRVYYPARTFTFRTHTYSQRNLKILHTSHRKTPDARWTAILLMVRRSVLALTKKKCYN